MKKHHFKIVPLILILMLLVYAVYERNIPACTKFKTVTYTIGPSDTLWSIGNYYSGNSDIREWICKVQEINKIEDCGSLQVGQKIKIEDWSVK